MCIRDRDLQEPKNIFKSLGFPALGESRQCGMMGGAPLPHVRRRYHCLSFLAKKTYAKKPKLSYNIVNVQIIGVEAAEQFRAWNSFR